MQPKLGNKWQFRAAGCWVAAGGHQARSFNPSCGLVKLQLLSWELLFVESSKNPQRVSREAMSQTLQ